MKDLDIGVCNGVTFKNKQQQQNFFYKQIKLQKYCLQLARLFEAGQFVQNIGNQRLRLLN